MQYIEEESWDGSLEKTMNVKTCVSHEEQEELIAANNSSMVVPPPPTQAQQSTPQAGNITALRNQGSASPSTPRRARFRKLSEIYEQEADNDNGMNSLFYFYYHVDDPIHFEDVVKEEKWIEAMNEDIGAIEKNDTWELVGLPQGKEVIGVKWVYKTKSNIEGNIERHKEMLSWIQAATWNRLCKDICASRENGDSVCSVISFRAT